MRAAALAVVCLAITACGGGGDEPPGPLIAAIPDAIAAVEAHYGAPQEYFEVSAGLESVSVIVAVDDATAAEQGSYDPDGGLTVPAPVGAASGETFVAGDIAFDPDRIFDQVRAELEDPAIIDFAIQGGPDNSVVYDASIASENGGVLLVLLGAEGQILGVQGR